MGSDEVKAIDDKWTLPGIKLLLFSYGFSRFVLISVKSETCHE